MSDSYPKISTSISKEEYDEFGPYIAVSQFKSWSSHFIHTSEK